MNDASADSTAALAARLTELETLFTHLQRTLAELDKVVFEQAKKIESLERQFVRITGDLGSLRGAVAERLKPEDEKPPHY
jgi:uncharacterized coiled-coil protein SlyX